MKFLVDAQLSPHTARWLSRQPGVAAKHVFDLGLVQSVDLVIFQAARDLSFDVILTKDQDFEVLVRRLGPPPHVLWLTCGNCTNEQVYQILQQRLPIALQSFALGEPLVEISDRST